MDDKLSMDEKFLNKLIDILEANLVNEQFGVSELAEEIEMSQSKLHHKLDALTGKSSTQFIREFRLEKAMDMLQNNIATASEIAYRVGFGSPTYFNTSFKEFYGYPPGVVKFRNASTDIDNGDPTNAKNTKKTFKQKRILAFSIVIVLLITLSYYFVQSTNDGTISETLSTENNDKSIAVLPFKNFSGNPDLDPFCNGMTDAVISRLTKIKSISKVSSRTSVFRYKNTEKSLPEIAKELGVTHILEGNFQKSGNKIKINLQLIYGPTDNHLWADEYTGKWNNNDIFEIQADVSENVAKNMDATITDLEMLSIHKSPTTNREAYTLYLQAEYQRKKSNEPAFNNAIPLYNKAISLDPNFAEAYNGLADLYMMGGLLWGIYGENFAWQKTKSLLLKARELDPSNEDVNNNLIEGYLYFEWNFDLVEKYYQNRLKQNFYDETPGLTMDYPIKTGRFSEALITIENHININPSIGVYYSFKASAFRFLGRIDEAKEILEISDPLYSDDWFYLRESLKQHYYLGEYDEFGSQLKKMMTNFTDSPPVILWFNLINSEMAGNKEDVSKYLAELHKRYEANNSGSPAWLIALYYASLKDYENTFTWLQKSYNRHEAEMLWLRNEPLLQPIKNDPRYKELYHNVGFHKVN